MRALDIALIASAFLLGGVPFSLIVGRLKGVDLRTVGSKNIGATNAARNLGLRWGVLCLLLDALKGVAPALVARLLLDTSRPHEQWVLGGVMLAAVCGHMFTPYLLFRGGKGVATALGVLLAVSPWVGLIGALLYVGLYAALHISSVGSMALTVSAPLLMLAFGEPHPLTYAVLAIAVLIVIKHIPNLRRLARGQEAKVR